MNVCRIFQAPAMPDEALIKRYSAVSTPAVSDSLERNVGAVGVLPVGDCLSGRTMAGPSLTVRTRPGDNLVVHKALDIARPGEVLVIDARGGVANAILGEIICRYANSRGIAGIIVDGAIRDSAEISAGDFPVFARGISHMGPYKSGPGEIYGPVSLGGVVVNAGDVVLGDEDGVVIVPRTRAEEAIDGAEAILEKEEGQMAAIEQGTFDRSWVDEALTFRRPL